MVRFIALHYSPWSEKARWALDHHRVEYREEEHVPMLGEPLLKLKTRKLRRKVTVPALIDDGYVYMDSFEIARWAERAGKGPTLFPGERLAEVRTWNERSEPVMGAGRPLVVMKTGESDDSLEESIPSFIPAQLRKASLPVARLGVRFLAKKYALDLSAQERFLDTMSESLAALQRAVARDRYLLGSFSYADVAMATALQFVRPVSDEYIRLGAATRAAWTQDTLAQRFPELLEWRDEIYGKHRRA